MVQLPVIDILPAQLQVETNRQVPSVLSNAPQLAQANDERHEVPGILCTSPEEGLEGFYLPASHLFPVRLFVVEGIKIPCLHGPTDLINYHTFKVAEALCSLHPNGHAKWNLPL